MLKIFNELKLFFEDNYRRIHVREYARIQGISPPTASTLLYSYHKENLLKKEEDKGYFYFFANRENNLFIQLQRAYYLKKFNDIGLIAHLNKNLLHPVLILFGSFAKAEITEHSDIDIAVFTPSGKKLDLGRFEEKLGREIQIFMFKNRQEAEKNPELLNNILNGFKLSGNW